jgi:tRNA-modifying protein YgfZ
VSERQRERTDDTADDGGYAALRHDVGVVELARDAVSVRGPAAVEFLQGQLSQDVAALPVGGSAESLVLQPQGRVDAYVRVWRRAEDEVVLDVDGGHGEALLARLDRFRLRVAADLEPVPWRCLALRGPRAREVDAVGAVLPADWPGWPGVDVVGEEPGAPEGVPRCSSAAWEAARIEVGVPRMGAELDERTIPAEAGIVDRTVSFTKGCFTGQELVARIDSRGGNVPRRLRGVLVADGQPPPAGAEVVLDGAVVGALTSVARSPASGTVALAYVRRAVELPAEAVVRWDGDERPARVTTLPMA